MTIEVGGTGTSGWRFSGTGGLLIVLAVCLGSTEMLQAQELDLQVDLLEPVLPGDPENDRVARPSNDAPRSPPADLQRASAGTPQKPARIADLELEQDRAWWQMLDYLSFTALGVGLLFFLGLAVWILRSPRLRSNPFNDLPTGVGPPDPGGIRWLSATLNTKGQRSRLNSRSSSRNGAAEGRSKRPDPPPP